MTTAEGTSRQAPVPFGEAFRALTGYGPFPWQELLFTQWLSQGAIPASCSVPTGLGKTNAVAVWLIALAHGARVPRRLVYVVNRRTVVDQTTAELEKLQSKLPKLQIPDLDTLAISTLRGQFADNGEWLADPSRPAVICGTVDMIGSRLLFEGYRIGFRSRPLHAGFLGQDALLVHDEAHLEPAFQALVERIQEEQRDFERAGDLPWPKLQVMALSATTRRRLLKNGEGESAFTITDQERQPPSTLPDLPTEPIHHVWRRLRALKQLDLHEIEEDRPVEKVVELAMRHGQSGAAVLIFLRRVEDTIGAAGKLREALKKAGLPQHVQTLTGTMRGQERDALLRTDGVFARFLPASSRSSEAVLPEGTVYLACTSAGEVGVDISADHLVCDLSTFDSMAQRLGRVNRYGDRKDTTVGVVHPKTFGSKDKGGSLVTTDIDVRRERTLILLRKLHGDASPLALDRLSPEDRQLAFAPEPTIPPATDILFDAWAMTSIRERLPGRPPIEPYLHGIAAWEPARTEVAWRTEVELLTPELLAQHAESLPGDLLDDYPLKPHEVLSDRSDRVYTQLTAMARRLDGPCPLWVVGDHGEINMVSLGELVGGEERQVLERIKHRTLLLPPCAGGLSADGTLDGTVATDGGPPWGHDVADQWIDETGRPRRQRCFSDGRQPANAPAGMALIRIVDVDPHAEEFDAEEHEHDSADDQIDNRPDGAAIATQGRFWYWYSRPRHAEDATRASAQPITWDHHREDVVHRAKQIAARLNLPDELTSALVLAARFHDLGKKRELWQRSIGNPEPDQWYAKPGKPVGGPRWRPRHTTDYRHEFGSLLDAMDPHQPHFAELDALRPEMRDVVLHLIAAHHGHARPHFPHDSTTDPNHADATADELARETCLRYSRLQRRYGRWGLAYLESLLRAADWAASANPTPAQPAPGENTQ